MESDEQAKAKEIESISNNREKTPDVTRVDLKLGQRRDLEMNLKKRFGEENETGNDHSLNSDR